MAGNTSDEYGARSLTADCTGTRDPRGFDLSEWGGFMSLDFEHANSPPPSHRMAHLSH